MTYQEALDQLVRWLDESLGQPIQLPSGTAKGLRLTQDYTEEEVEDFEDEWDIDFPEPYRQFLLQVGACELFYGGAGKGRGVSISRLDSIAELFHEYFDQEESPMFDEFLPVGAVYSNQHVAAFGLDGDEPENFALFSDEHQAQDWDEWAHTAKAWRTFEDWVIELVQTEGEFEAAPPAAE